MIAFLTMFSTQLKIVTNNRRCYFIILPHYSFVSSSCVAVCYNIAADRDISLFMLWIEINCAYHTRDSIYNCNDTIQISYIILPGDTAFLDFSLFNFSFCFGVAIFAHLATRLLDLTTFPKDQINLNKKTKKIFRK